MRVGVKKWEIASGSRKRTEDLVLFEKASCSRYYFAFLCCSDPEIGDS